MLAAWNCEKRVCCCHPFQHEKHVAVNSRSGSTGTLDSLSTRIEFFISIAMSQQSDNGMSSTRAPSSGQRLSLGQNQSCEQTTEEKALALSLRGLGFDLKPGQSGIGEALRWASQRGFLEQVHLLLRVGSKDEAFKSSDEWGFTAAHLAAFYNQAEVLRALIEAGADTNIRDHTGCTPLHLSALEGHCEVAEVLLANGSDPSLVDDEGLTASHRAAKENQCDMLHVLAAAGDDLSAVDNYGDSLLHAAARGGARETFEMLVNTRAGILRWRNDTGWTPVHVAVVESSVEMVKHVLDVATSHQFQDTGFDIDSARSDDGATSLIHAVRVGSREAVELLLDYGANIHTTDHMEGSALHSAVAGGYTELVRDLIRRGADVNARHRGGAPYAVLDAVHFGYSETLEALLEGGARLLDATTDDGYTALHLAAYEGHLGLLRLLLKKDLSLDINTRSLHGSTPLIIATGAGRFDAVRMLLDHGANASTSDYAGLTPLHWAVNRNRPRIVRMLLEHGADPLAESADGHDAVLIAHMSLEGVDLEEMMMVFSRDIECLHTRDPRKIALKQLLLAAESGKLDLITALVQGGDVNVNSEDEDGYTGLLFASENGQDDAVELLIRLGAEVDAKNVAGESSIWLASRYGHEAIVRTLIENGADLDSSDELDQTAISAAAEGGHLRVVEILLEKGADIRTRTCYGKTAQMFAAKGGHDTIVHVFLTHDTNGLPQIPFDLHEVSLALTRKYGPQHAMHIVDSSDGGTFLDIGPDSESREFPQSAVKGVASSGEDDSPPGGIGVHGSDGDEEENSDEERFSDEEDSLVEMAETGMTAAVDRLIRAGHALDQKGRHGYLALGVAAVDGHFSTVRTLLDHGFDPDLQDGQGRTALWWAAYDGRYEVAKLLMDAGADINIVDYDILVSPLMAAAYRGHIKVLDLLLMAGAKKELVETHGFSALGLAISFRHLEVVKHLLESGVNVECGSNSEMTPLSIAIGRGEAKIVRLLLEAGALTRTWAGNVSLLCVAAQRGDEDVVKVLIEHGAEVDHVSDAGWTPLFYAASFGHGMVVRILMEMGCADVKHRDKANWSAQSVAKVRGHEGVAAQLRHASRFRNGASAASIFPEPNYYAYSPLSEPSRIRVLDLHPGQEHDPISFDLYEVRLESDPSYEALSYEWKDKRGSVVVQCNGRSLLITPNLKLALQNIRLGKRARTLWVDAVCINQEDAEERSSQVRMMTAIYKKASTVLMWLGKDSREAEQAIASIPAVLSSWDRITASDIFTYTLSTDLERVLEGMELCRKVFATMDVGGPYSHRADSGAAELLCRSYFTRAWIYQELVLAGARGLVLCGRLSVRWRDFLHFIATWATWKTGQNGREKAMIMHIAMASARVAGRGMKDMGDAMKTLTYLNCGDPRDKVFAVLGIVDPSWSGELAPDYSLSVQQVYTNAARALIRTTLGLAFWQGVNHPRANRIPSLPSWVPDWTCISDRYLELDDGAVLPSLFRHPVGRHVPSLVGSQFQTTDTALYADGYVIGEVAFCVTMRAGEDIYQTIIRPLTEGLATLGLSIFDRCPNAGTMSYLSLFSCFLHGSIEKEEVSLDLIQTQAAFLIWKMIADDKISAGSQKVPPELKDAVQDLISQSSIDESQFKQKAHRICFEWEETLKRRLRQFTELSANDPGGRTLASCDLFCTRSGYLGVAGEGSSESGLVLVLLEGFGSVAMMRKKEDAVEGDWYEFVDGADILELDWQSYRTLEDVPVDGKMERLKIL